MLKTDVNHLADEYDLVIALDIPSRSRSREVFARARPNVPVVAVDHHPPLETVGDPEWKDPRRSSTGEMVAHLALAAGWDIPPEAATCLYAAILTDTGRFTFSNTTPLSMHIAAHMIQLGASCVEVCDAVYGQEPYNLMELRAEATQNIRLHARGAIAVMRIPLDLLMRWEVDPIDTGELPDLPRAIKGVEVGVLLRELESGRVKVSLRARAGTAVDAVARKFGGGGHRQAAGCEVTGSLHDVEERVVTALCDHLGLTDKVIVE
jgi:phosphoesterase RecJ-like protein